MASSAGTPSQRFFRQWLHRFSSAHVPLSASRLLGQRRSCTDFPCSPNTPVSDAAHRCAPVWAVHLSRILYMLTAHLSICYASLTLSRRFAIILMEETALVDFIRFLCISFRTQGAIFLAPAACLPVTNPINKLRWGCEAVQRAIAKPSGRLRRGETPATKRTISENAAFHPKSNQRPCSARLAEPFPP